METGGACCLRQNKRPPLPRVSAFRTVSTLAIPLLSFILFFKCKNRFSFSTIIGLFIVGCKKNESLCQQTISNQECVDNTSVTISPTIFDEENKWKMKRLCKLALNTRVLFALWWQAAIKNFYFVFSALKNWSKLEQYQTPVMNAE